MKDLFGFFLAIVVLGAPGFLLGWALRGSWNRHGDKYDSITAFDSHRDHDDV